MEMEVSKRIGFNAAHYLPGYKGKCSRMHGHYWVVEVACSGSINEQGFVVDFTLLKNFLEIIERRFDHNLVNDIIKMPTAENIVLNILVDFKLWCLVHEVRWSYVKVWETEDSCATIINTPSRVVTKPINRIKIGVPKYR